MFAQTAHTSDHFGTSVGLAEYSSPVIAVNECMIDLKPISILHILCFSIYIKVENAVPPVQRKFQDYLK